LRGVGLEEGRKRLAAVLIERAISNREQVTCRQLMHESLPEFVKENVLAWAHNRLKQEKPFSWNFNANFDVNDAEVRASFEKLLAALTRSIRLSRQEIEKCVRDAVFSRHDILLRPAQTVENLVFNPTDRHEKKNLQFKLDLMGKDIPFVLRCQEQMQSMEEAVISRTSFAVMAQEVKTTLYAGRDHSAVIKEFDLFVQLYKVEEGLRPIGVEAALLEEFLLSRGMEERIPFVKKKVNQGKNQWRREDFEDIFEFSLSQGHPSLAASAQGTEEFILPKIIFPEEEKGPVYQAQREHQPPGPYPSIHTLIDAKDSKVFVLKLFERDERAYQTFIDKVDRIDKWREAKQLIDWELNKRKLDPYSREAVKLGDVVFSKYFTNSRYI
jgi:hypothetical protein